MRQYEVRNLTGGVNQSGVRDHNERLVLSMIQRHTALPGSDIARIVGLTPQTVSVILRRLESDGLIKRCAPIRGGVGKPRVPMSLDPEGVFSIGVKIGRRTTEVVLLDFTGRIRAERSFSYRYPVPAPVFRFLSSTIIGMCDGLTAPSRARIAGIGIAKPFELWNWHDSVGAPEADLAPWKEIDFAEEVAKFSDLPVFLENDATAACRAEHVFGRGREFRDYAYFFVGAFIGGGVVLNGSVFEGGHGNAGAFGPLPSVGPDGRMASLIDTASLYLLEKEIEAQGGDPARLWLQPQDWADFSPQVDQWIEIAGPALARAVLTVSAVFDFEVAVIDGALPDAVRQKLVRRIRTEFPRLDVAGLVVPGIVAGSIGAKARAIGAACKPIQAQFLLNSHGVPALA